MVSGPSVTHNVQQACRLIAHAAAQGAELVVLPEYFCLIGDHDTDKLAIAEHPGDGPIQKAMSDCALAHGVWLVAGTIPLKSSQVDRITNSVLVFDPTGQRVARYDKIHLFQFSNGQESYDEAKVLIHGTTPCRFSLTSRDHHVWTVGLSVCYDLRFPELYRQLESDLLLVPAAFTYTTGLAHWEVLLRARAIENLAFVVASAQGGKHPNGRRTYGNSMIINPWGDILNSLQEGEGMVIADCHAGVISERRRQLPALSHRVLI